MDVENFTLTYPDVYQLMRELKTLGANNVTSGRRNSLTGKNRIKNMASAYEEFRTDGNLPATYEVVYGHAWEPELTNNTQNSHSSNKTDVSISIDQLKIGTRL
ncbi:MAG: malonyl-[acyl-carrier protein] O-methyltransferase BioC, partial [Cycloclasticus sp.]|nr:malonyl-[acyl-carrier protein] O-methyltransferase BioC [Cycloclasticus sp.]